MDSLDLAIKNGIKPNFHLYLLSNDCRQIFFVGRLHLPPLGAKVGVFRERYEGVQLVKVCDPCVSQTFADHLGEPRITELKPATLGDSIGFVVKALRIDIKKIAKQLVDQNSRMEVGHPVNRVTADDGEMRHAHLFLVAFFNQRHPLQSVCVPLNITRHVLQESPVDLIDDLQNARENSFKQ